MARWPKCAATNRAGSCLWCGDTLRPVRDVGTSEEWSRAMRARAMGEKDPRPIVGYGYAAGGSFCSLRCGFLFGEKMVEFGHRVSPRDDS